MIDTRERTAIHLKVKMKRMKFSDRFRKTYGKYGDDNRLNTYILRERLIVKKERNGKIRIVFFMMEIISENP
jgi:hypothetical protein